VRKATGTSGKDARWFEESKLDGIPLGTTAKKALRLIYNRR
jgi:hypothetical protein